MELAEEKLKFKYNSPVYRSPPPLRKKGKGVVCTQAKCN